jgi:anti-sigma factor RsiW
MAPSCWLIRRRLGAYQDGELPPGPRRRVEAHLRGCQPCSQQVQALAGLRTALALDVADPSEAVWTAFWPQVRARIAAPAPAPASGWQRAWDAVRVRPRLVLAPALAAGALAVLAVVAPWQRVPQQAPAPSGGLEATGDQVVIQSIETEDPDLPVMVFKSPESDVTVLWVFGLPQTDT